MVLVVPAEEPDEILDTLHTVLVRLVFHLRKDRLAKDNHQLWDPVRIPELLQYLGKTDLE